MNEFVLVVVLFLVGVVILVAEIFIPSHGILGVGGLSFLGYAVYRAYEMDTGSGHLTLLAAVIIAPTLAVVGVKVFHRTPIGRRIAPDNPDPQAAEFAPRHEQLKRLVGLSGRSVTPLRPVGTCIIDGQRVNCVAEAGLIESGVEVEVLRIRGSELEVRPTNAATSTGRSVS